MRAAIEFLRTHKEQFPFDSMVTHRFVLERANEALETTAKWIAAKSVIIL